MTKFRPILYWGAAILGLALYFFLTREKRNEDYGPSVSSKASVSVNREPAAQIENAFPKKISNDQVHKSVLGGDRILDIRETLEASGRIRQIALIERPRFKYPLLISKIILDPQGEIVSRNETIADHLMVRLKNKEELESFSRDLSALGAQIRQQKEDSGIYLVQFNGKSLGALEKMKNAILGTGKVEYAEEDRVIHLPRQREKRL